MPLIIPANSLTGGYEVDNSLRFDDGSSDYLNRTPASASNQDIWTYSAWIKLSVLGIQRSILSAGNTTYYTDLRIDSDDKITFYIDDSVGTYVTTTQVLRDVSAWYNIVVVFETAQATASNRVKIYLNGSQITSFSGTSYPALNYQGRINSGDEHSIGRRNASNNHFFDGYISEVCFIDGQALDPTSFGEFDADTGIWKPKAVSGLTFGTNGFYLDFENSGSLGADVSGNGNNFTVNNLTSVDQVTDTPTNNWCLPNALAKGSDIVLAEGNTSITRSTASWNSCMSTIAVDQGKWYWEQKVSSLGIINCGVTKSKQDGTTHSSVDAGRVMYSSNGNIYVEGFANSPIATGTTFTTNDIIGIALNLDAGTIGFYKNGSLIYTYSNAGLTTNEMTPAWGLYSATWLVNFGNPAFTISSGNSDANGYGNFEYAVPSGYYALCTKNLAEFG